MRRTDAVLNLLHTLADLLQVDNQVRVVCGDHRVPPREDGIEVDVSSCRLKVELPCEFAEDGLCERMHLLLLELFIRRRELAA